MRGDIDDDRSGQARSRRPLIVAVAQPVCAPGEVAANAVAHAAAVNAATARVVIFPELSLTGYELNTAPVVDPRSEDLAPLIAACAATGATALVGAPALDPAGNVSIATLAVTGAGAHVAYRKMWLGTDELRRFYPGDRTAVLDIDGWLIGLAVCKDTSISAHTTALARLGIDVYAAGLVMHPHETSEQNHRGAHLARTLGCHVAFASFAGPTGSGYPNTAGQSSIWDPAGHLLTHVPAGDTLARATLDPLTPARLLKH